MKRKYTWDLYFIEDGNETFVNRFFDTTFNDVISTITKVYFAGEYEIQKDMFFYCYWIFYNDTVYRLQLFQ